MATVHSLSGKTMQRALLSLGVLLLFCLAVLIVWAGVRVRANSIISRGSYRNNWSPVAAANYLDSREAWWQSWPPAQLSHETFCISCHTTLPYAMARPGLRAELGETALTDDERQMLSSIEERVTDWQQTSPYYTDPAHAAPSHATEAILNTVILAEYSAMDSRLSPIARRAFDEAWALQKTAGEDAGGWEWQDFHEAPWESPESAYQGAAFMAYAVGTMPASYSNDPSARDHIELLRRYLQQHYAAQPLMNQIYVLWASSQMPGLLSDSQRKDLIGRVTTLQRPDGGWSLSSLDAQKAFKKFTLDIFKRVNQVDGSDGIATGLVVLALEKVGISPDDPGLKRGLAWLESHQFGEGSWWASSLNGFRSPSTDLGRFMSDAATGYAVLALEQAQNLRTASAPKRDETTVTKMPGSTNQAVQSPVRASGRQPM